MKETKPEVYLAAKPSPDLFQLLNYLFDIGGEDWAWPDGSSDGEKLVEFAGRLCYRSWKPGLNPNVRKVRDDSGEYLQHILESGHGSVLEHANYGFIFRNVSRVFTHELVRHRAGVAISQESLRFVRLTGIPMWIPDWAKEDMELVSKIWSTMNNLEDLQDWMTAHFNLESPDMKFSEKKTKTSFMRRFLPEGVSTDIMWTANIRALRHVIEARTDQGAEEEIRMVFGKVAEIMIDECPLLFGDFEPTFLEDGTASFKPRWHKV